MLEVINISKSFCNKKILRNINFSVSKGTILGLVGPNGAGKTTLLRTIVDIYKPDGGEVKIKGENIRDNFNLKNILGYLDDNIELIGSYKVIELINYYGLAYKNFDKDKFHNLNKVFEIPLKGKVSNLSKGNITRLAFMLNLSISPELLILDEPTAGFDPIIKKKFLQILIDEVSERGTTIIISSHNLNDLENICDQVVFLNNGEIIKDSSLEALKASMKKLQVVFQGDAPEGLAEWKEFIAVNKVGKSYTVITSNYSDTLTEKLKKSGALFIEELGLSLEDMLIYSVDRQETKGVQS